MTFRPPLYMQNSDLFSYAAADDRFIIDTLFSEGILNVGAGQGLAAQRPDGANMSVLVPPFDAIVDGDDAALQGAYLLRMTVAEYATVTGAPASGSRIDLLVCEVVDSAYRTTTAANPEGPRLRVIAGTAAASNPTVPALPPTAIPLAQITVAAGQSSIVTSNITDLRTQAGAATLQVGTQFAKMTTAQRDAINNPAIGQSIFNTTSNRNETYLGVTLGWVAGGGITMATVTTSQTVPVPPNARFCRYTVIGGGAGGTSGYYNNGSTTVKQGGAGGGAGAVRQGTVDVSTLTSLSATIGAGGIGGAGHTTADTYNPGTDGASSTLVAGSTTITAPGGAAPIRSGNVLMQTGRYGAAGQAATPAASYDSFVRSGDGGYGVPGDTRFMYGRLCASGSPVAGLVCGGAAGTTTSSSGSPYGAGGFAGRPDRAVNARGDTATTPGSAPAVAGEDATFPGCGGGGGGTRDVGTSYPAGKGGNGAAGVIILEFLG